MSCWVVPSLAAELWRMPLDQVMRLVADGAVPTKQEEGFTFIDVAPNSPKLAAPKPKPEPHALTFIPAADDDDVDVLLLDDPLTAELIGDAEPDTPIEDEASKDFGDWRTARSRISLTRIGPPKRRSSA